MKLRIVAVGALSFVAVASAAAPQSLGDIARKAAIEREAKSKDGKAPPPVTVTNKDLTSVAAPGSVPPVKAASEPRAGGKAPAAPAAASAKDEAYWRAKMRPLRDKLLSDRSSSAVVAKRLTELRYNVTSDPGGLAAARAEKVRLTTEMQNWNVILDTDLRAMADLREDGRRAGALPAWLR